MTCALATRQLVADAVELAALDRERRRAVGRLDRRAHLRERLGDPLHRAAASDSSPVSSKRPGSPARIPASRRIDACPSCRSRSAAPGSRRPRRPTPWTRSASASSSWTVAPSARNGTDRRLGVAASGRSRGRLVCRRRRSHPSSTRPVRDRLVAGTAMCRAGRPPGRSSRRQHRRDDDAVALGLEQRAPPARPRSCRSRAASACRRARVRRGGARSPRC